MDGLDPIQAAGVRWCRTCRAEAWPTDATWLAEDLLLVTYDRLCHHNPRPLAMTVTPSQLEDLSDRCSGTTAAGTRCRARPAIGGEFCRHHDPSRRGARR